MNKQNLTPSAMWLPSATPETSADVSAKRKSNGRGSGCNRDAAPEITLQEDAGWFGNALAWLFFSALAIWVSVSRWWSFKRVCAWCKPQRYLGGNPFSKNLTHGMCKSCGEQFLKPSIENRQS